MSTPPPSDARDGSPSRRSRRTITLAWFVAILAAAGLLVLLLVRGGIGDAGGSLLTVAWVLIPLSLALSTWTRKKQRDRYRRRFPTLDVLRQHVDADALRKVRDRDGQNQAVKRLRHQIPEMPLTDAVQLIKSL
ncbi:hypothetical protein N566_26010 [Streptomycetaceae bacterium MP113-05]|nr:hypothetical protein N566_26010 [Streptomycetaceae bacterium MP113-05]